MILARDSRRDDGIGESLRCWLLAVYKLYYEYLAGWFAGMMGWQRLTSFAIRLVERYRNVSPDGLYVDVIYFVIALVLSTPATELFATCPNCSPVLASLIRLS